MKNFPLLDMAETDLGGGGGGNFGSKRTILDIKTHLFLRFNGNLDFLHGGV